MHSFASDLTSLLSLNGLITLLTLTILEIVLGIDNIIFISIAVDKLPREQQSKARTIGLLLALVVRTVLLFFVGYIAGLKEPFMHLGAYGISGKALILMGGGLFLLIKTWQEIQEHIHGDEDEIGHGKKGKATFNAIIMQIIIIDFVFSFDSILAAVGLSGVVLIMVSAVVISMILMILFSGVVADFINKNPGIKMIALSFLLVIGGILVAEALIDSYNSTLPHEQHFELNKNYAYIALAFAMMIELFNIKERKIKRAKDFKQQDEE
ncbi:MAG: TerC family protein [Bacteroidetes bacterium]|jgi:predicted tellurium resistance membrane protein TerC|nr:TerC family protein [Bacteroidota bacterium]